LIGRVIAGQSDRVFLVSKVWPNHVMGVGIARACDASLGRLGTDHLAIALLVNPNNEMAQYHIRTTQEAARAKGVKLAVAKATSEPEIDSAFTALKQLQAGGLLVANASLFSNRREQLVALAARHAVPTIYSWPDFVAAGGLISYGTDIDALYRQAGIYAGRILKGAKPGDLPVQQPTTFELVVNLKTSEVLGLTIPRSILTRADELIE